MKCACPWCPNEAEKDKFSLFAGKPTCSDHSDESTIGEMNFDRHKFIKACKPETA